MKFRSEQARARYLAFYDQMAARWPVPSESLLADTSQGSTFVRISGPKDAPPLVLLPGAHSSSQIFETNIEALARHRRVYALDNIVDYGRSIPVKEPTNASEFVAWLDELLEALELRGRVDLAGLSYGGWISSQYALARPERVAQLVLIAPAATVLPLSRKFMFRAVGALLPFRWATNQLVTFLLGDSLSSAKQEAASPDLAQLMDLGLEGMWLGSRCYKLQMIPEPTVLSDDELCKLSATKTLFLVGENEKIYSTEEAASRLTRLAADIRVEVVPNAGHLFSATHSREVNERIIKFLK
jgi:pimeloyl-ACP methyl ester carboxylesterase